jgi:hypothetical protein
MSVAPEQDLAPVRHPLGLPPGSVRAVLALMIAGLFWLLLVLPDSYEERVPLFLYVLLGLIMVFFGAHGHTIGHHIMGHSPLYLPRGLLRAFLILGTAALLGWLYYSYPERTTLRLTPAENQLAFWHWLLLAAFGGFGFGYLVGKGPWRRSAAFQDLIAWVSLLAMIGLVIETIWMVFVKPSMEKSPDLLSFETVLTAVVAFYYGARS